MIGELPSAESLVGWLLENQSLPVADLSDSDSLSSFDAFSDTDSMSDDLEDLQGAFGQTPPNLVTSGFYNYLS